MPRIFIASVVLSALAIGSGVAGAQGLQPPRATAGGLFGGQAGTGGTAMPGGMGDEDGGTPGFFGNGFFGGNPGTGLFGGNLFGGGMQGGNNPNGSEPGSSAGR